MYSTDGLTIEEHGYVGGYSDAVNGIPDSFDLMNAAGLRDEAALRPGGLADVVRVYVGMLRDWHGALDTLAADLAAPDGRHSPAAARFLWAETGARERTADTFHRAVLDALAGAVDPTARADGGYAYSSGYLPDPAWLAVESNGAPVPAGT
ncbi:hypothetical protein CcI49_06750 [Frankia sp. CcI49]|uniref:hypothetical protein n=1 Tax=Frankia sp. CcI49 TaxID=1745382 RepID=UPI0009759721|nr:hypothetical protein [Frankia sp. CcI49]ONH61282.1 hypothetical protein CcI49_06750 [Frankia sp. CcI49]